MKYDLKTPHFTFSLEADSQDSAIKALNVVLDMIQTDPANAPLIEGYDVFLELPDGTTIPATRERPYYSNKISLIKAVRDYTACGLKEAKDYVENPAASVCSSLKVSYFSKQDAERLVRDLKKHETADLRVIPTIIEVKR